MVIRFSDIFRGEDHEINGDTGTRQEDDASLDASNDGLRVESESNSRDEQGRESHDRTSVDTGETDIASDIDVDNDVDQNSDLSASSDDGVSDGQPVSADGTNDTDADQSVDANAGARNDGVTVENESYSRDEDGEISSDRTSAETGETATSMDFAVENMADSFTGLSGSWDETAAFD